MLNNKKKKSLTKSIILNFILAVSLILLTSLIGYYLLFNNQITEELVHISIDNNEEVNQVKTILRRTALILVFNTAVIAFALVKITDKKILIPIKQINEAMQKVADGNFNIKLETTRNDEIGDLTKNFNRMAKELGSVEYLQKDFIDNVSHEIRTPINSIQGFTDLLKDDNLSKEERNEDISIINGETARILNLSNNMLKLSKLQNQNRITSKDEINIAEQIRKAITFLENKWKEKELKFNIDMEEEYFFGDEDLLFQVWTNLIDNSIKFSKQNGEIDISLEKNEEKIEVKIRDYGIGMNDVEKEKIFTKFYQIDKSHSKHGSGLGLAIAKRIIDLSEGAIEVQSEKNVGTTMIVKLPIEKENKKIIIQ